MGVLSSNIQQHITCPNCGSLVPVYKWRGNSQRVYTQIIIRLYCEYEWYNIEDDKIVHLCNDTFINDLYNANRIPELQTSDLDIFQELVNTYWEKHKLEYILGAF